MGIFRRGSLALVFALAACGGSGSGGSSGSGTATSTPTPTVTPTPTPTPTPAFGLSSPFELEISVGVEFRTFTYTDNISPFPRTRTIEARLLDASDSASLSYEPDPEIFRLTFNGVEYAYTAADRTVAGEDRLYQRDEFRLALGPILATDTEAMIVSHAWTPEGYTNNTEVGTARRWLIAPIGNVSVEQSEIESPIHFESVPGVVGGDVYITKSRVSLTTNGITSTGKGVNGTFHLFQNIDNAAEPVGEVRLLGTLNAQTNLFEGTIVDATNLDVDIGTFRGALYGPGREWLGLVFQFSRP